MRNFWPSYRGPAYSRAGTAFVGFSRQTGRNYPPRLIPFQFSTEQGLALEFGNFYMRVISDGAFVTEPAVSIVGVSQADPGVVTISAFSVAGATANNGAVSSSYLAGDTITLAGGTFTAPAVLTANTTTLTSVAVNSPGSTATFDSYAYRPGDTIALTCAGSFSQAPVLVVNTTKVIAVAVYAAGSGGTPGTQTVTGVSGSGTKFTASVTVNSLGHISAINSITSGGAYTSNPYFYPGFSYLDNVTGGGLTGAAFTLIMGVDSVSILNGGSFTANAAGGAFTQASTSGSGSGATFNSALFGPGSLAVTNAGQYSVFPSNPASQASTSGAGAGATFDLTEANSVFNTGDWVFVSGVEGMTELNGNTYQLTQLTSMTYSLQSANYGANVDTSGFGAYTGGGTLARIFTFTTPYGEADLPYLKYTQSADVMSLCCVNQQTLTEYPPFDLARLADDNWTLNQVSPAPTISPPGAVSAAASSSGSVDYQYVVTTLAPDGTESIASPIGEVDSAVDIATTAGEITVTWSGVAGATDGYYVYKASPGYGSSPPVGAIFGFAGQAFGGQFVDSNIVPDFTQVPPTHQNPFAQGQILAVSITDGGAGYVQGSVGYTINTATGSGAVLMPVVVGGAIVAVLVLDAGQNYQPSDTIAFSGQSPGSGAAGTFTTTTTDKAIETITLSNGGSNYIAPTVAPHAGAGFTTAPVFVIETSGGSITNVSVTTSGLGGTGGTLVFSDSAPGGSGATGTLTIGPQSGTYPSVPGYFQERRVYANSLNAPDTYWMSQPGAYTNFDTRNPTISSDAVTGTPWGQQVNGIQWTIMTSGGLLVMTGLSAWLLVGAGSFATSVQPISPSTQDAVPQAFSGCSTIIPPIKINYDVVYVESKDSRYYDLPYQLYALSEPIDLTEVSPHLFAGYTIREHAWCEQPNKLLWAVRDDGVLLSMTYYKTQQISGWARHDTQGEFVSVCSVVEPPVDALYLATLRTPGGGAVYTIERMDDRIWPDVESTWCVDAGLALAQPTPNATLTISSAHGLGAITGSTNLVGGANYSAATTAAIIDTETDQNGNPYGSGATATLTIAGGVVTAVAIPNEGSGYRRPQLVISDPAGSQGGSGASATLTLGNAANVTASAGVFTAAGQVIRAGGGIATIINVVSANVAGIDILSPFPVAPNTTDGVSPFAAGDWTLSTPVTTIGGLDHLIGATVTGLADGNVIAPTVVDSQGQITLTTAASAVTVGLAFQAQMQDVPIDVGAPTVQGQRKKVSAVTVRLEASRGVKVGVNQVDGSTTSPAELAPVWSQMQLAPDSGPDAPNFPPVPYNALATPLRTGDVRVATSGGWETPGQVAIQQDFPLPCQVVAIIAEILGGDTPQTQAPPKGKGR